MFSQEQSDAQFSRNAPIRWEKWLPDYATPLPCSITKQDCRFLKKAGAFDIPDSSVRDELIKNYIEFVHPLLPILNLEDFLAVIEEGYAGSQGISFLFFQAIMFAATPYESAESIAQEGFRDRREARKTRYERVKLLYLSGCEDDCIAILQAVLLLTYWDESSEDFRDSWYWVGVAKALVTSIENQPESQDESCPMGLWRRIRWSCYMRDRLISITKRWPLQIRDTEFDIPMLTMSDFEMGPLSTKGCLGTDGSHPAIRDPPTKRLLAHASIALACLCRCISRVIESQYTVTKTDSIRPAPRLVPKTPAATPGEVLLRDSELEEWRSSLPEALRWRAPKSTKRIHRHDDVKNHFRATLAGFYNIATSALHRPQAVCLPYSFPELRLLSEQRVRDSAISTAKIHEYFCEQGRAELMPDGQVAMLESAILAHLSSLRSTSATRRQLALQGFQSCARALKQLSNTYASAEESLALVNVAVSQTDNSWRGQPSDLFPHQGDIYDSGSEGRNSASSEERDTSLQFSLWEHVNKLEPPQVGKLLFSHFMITPWERNLLDELAPPEGEDRIHADELRDSMFEQLPRLKPQSTPSDNTSSPTDIFAGKLAAQSSQEDGQQGGNSAQPTPGLDQPIDLDFVQGWNQLEEIEWDFFTMQSH
ncbi:uncharacterized protein N7496_005676 [Penicillium cataractarum]|uniref:Xylanolytic transcriptional activator regulatory domain-containing protein n=1 Tax=Penicillium cataractarum TaxID=2100454 RepID=A0A9W9VDS3_9EURO|nr:uncharacterized protein N7496_005676 [Penicillium cataractarum]KAJ5378267.1 hypothetical protein N7496_005676 [Penicillium cataractarum]